PVNLIPFLTVEPFFAHSALGDASQSFGGFEYTRSGYDVNAYGVNGALGGFEYTRSGYDVNAYGVNVALGGLGLVPGFPLYPYAGISSSKLSRDGSEDITETSYNAGVGFGFSLPPGVSIHARGELNIVATGETSRKFANVNVGVAYK